MAEIIAHDNETVDALAYRVFGNTDAVERIYQLNQNLSSHGIYLPHGTKVTVPDTVEITTQQKQRTNLWT